MLVDHVGLQQRGDDHRELCEGKKLRVLLLDDCALHRAALRSVLVEAANAHVMEGASKEEAFALFRRSAADVILLNFTFGETSGVGLIENFLRARPSVKILVLSERPKASYASRALASGAVGYISKSASSEELLKALATMTQGKIYLDPEIATKLALKHVRGGNDVCDALTVREQEILRLIGEGKNIKCIAATFGVAYKTVANACTRIKTKLDAKCTSELVKIAYELHED